MAESYWEETKKFLERLKNKRSFDDVFNTIGKQGVDALASASPVQTGMLANSWTYKIVKQGEIVTIEWHNSDIEGGYNIAMLVQMGHGTGRGVYVPGTDYINPAMAPVFDNFAEMIWEEVLKK